MRIIVCLKPVPDPKYWSRLRLDSKTKTLIRDGIPSIINPLDKNALEAALQLQEKEGGEVIILSMAPLFCLSILREALAMGGDRAVLLSDKVFAGSDTLATSYILSEGVKKIGPFDLILCGNQTIDGWTGHVGPQLSEFLGIEGIGWVRMIEAFHFDQNAMGRSKKGSVIVRRNLDHGYIRIKAPMPVLLSVVKDINTPRYTTFAGILEAEKKEIQILSASDLKIDPSQVGLTGSPTKMADLFMPEMRRRKEIIQEKPEAASRLIIEKIHQRGLI